MSPAMSGKNIQLTRSLSHELFNKVLSVLSTILSHTNIEKILSTSECSWGYGPPIEMGIVSEISSHDQLSVVKLSS